MTPFGEPYQKIETMFKRTDRGVIVPWDWTCPEFSYLADRPWRWTEKVDGTNIRLHWDGEKVTVGGRTDAADVPAKLTANLQAAGVLDADRWRSVFPEDATDVTVYGEGYGAGIQKGGGNYRPEQFVIVFDVRVSSWWLRDADVNEVASELGLEVVPTVGEFSLVDAWMAVTHDKLSSVWGDQVAIEGLVGRPTADLFNRRGQRIITKTKVRDWTDYQRRGPR